MRKRPSRWSSSAGMTTIEILIAVTVLGILVSIVAASYETLKAKVRFTQVRADMDSIAKAAFNDFTSHDNNWAAFVGTGVSPSFVNVTDLSRWPSPPCPGWEYSWDNWTAFPNNLARVSLYRADGSPVFGFCLQSIEGNCLGPDVNGLSPQDLAKIAIDKRYIYCNE